MRVLWITLLTNLTGTAMAPHSDARTAAGAYRAGAANSRGWDHRAAGAPDARNPAHVARNHESIGGATETIH